MLVDGRADTVRLSDTDFVFLYESGYARKAAALFAADTGPFVITGRSGLAEAGVHDRSGSAAGRCR
jgi:hypothetical protein